MKRKVAILIVSYNGVALLRECLTSLRASADPEVDQRIFIVDNDSQDGTEAYIRDEWPQVHLIPLDANVGFSGGNNRGWNAIRDAIPDISYVLLLNQDTVVDRRFLVPLVRYMDEHPHVGCAQPALMLYPQKDAVNSLGNVIHFLGFGYSSYNGWHEHDVSMRISSINYASGSAALLRAAAIDQVGLFDDFMFMYQEDLDLGWRLRLAGWDITCIPESRIYHKYDFSRGMRQYYYFERNRLWVLLKNYRLRTLLALLPAWLLMECGQVLHAVRNRVLLKKIRSYAYFFSFKTLAALRLERRRTQRLRVVSDRTLLRQFSGVIDFQPLRSFTLARIANPVLNIYFSAMKKVIFW